ncbi:glucose-6-phosphate dehydrogenase assembly protein OpcA [Crocosphaera watsonii WH 8501]|uniref:OpcA n=7 Tax=Crocosphaera TaxID=263510 RepID=Q4C2R1_CROWT|nr:MULTISPECIES: glucose-6-phosphate dehydrogenase assembly protein OpcA [Crocosphaera]EAM50447.1 OpcA [Crocosphaera watsonii WH 8501]MCH2245214.1 glucose-6-phosphate dehydrogenase assembly protein OpcA [Crocosphaera sp.]CCQ49004.1 OpcA, an allosteric effector of glucose-6-phosphate dehydrogenase, cyanobacterial [Crocosphaera watsonii WH 8502]CCQ61386.1 OpcA, an allosteric effector of glucose-6-phosphate dehydrogenase, cyanobacterial [Crocosphaera watsonii WH 0401]
MTTQTPPLVSLQDPKDVSIDVIEAELSSIWQSYSDSDDGIVATRATSFTFIVYEPEPTQHLLAALGFYTGPVDGIAGPRTTAAIKSAQKAYKMEVTGKSNQEFIHKLQTEFEQAKVNGQLNEEQKVAAGSYTPDLEGTGLADSIAASNPCRIITLCPTVGEDEGVKAQVSAYCPINKRSQNTLVCCEYITLTGTAAALERVGGIISELTISGLPTFVWWKASPEPEYGLFKRLASQGDTLVVDSSTFSEPEGQLVQLGQMLEQNIPLADLNWGRLSPWQELTAAAFDPPERRNAVLEIDRVTIDYEKGNATQALMFLGWLASRLQWKPVAYEQEGGDYDITRVKFLNNEQKTIEAELAGVPVADWGDVLGDLISLKLSSTNLQADCCTVLCSGTTGCMRMEASGGAQACRIEQVTSLADQQTDQLIQKQLQRWGTDALYEESIDVTMGILKLAQNN